MTEQKNGISNGLEQRILHSLRRIIRAVEVHSKRLSAEHEITGPQLVCLHALAQHGPRTNTQLAREVHLSPSTIVGIVDRLCDKGLVDKTRGDADRRLVRVALTTRGREMVATAPSPLQERLAAALNQVTELEQATIALSLERIVTLMEVDSATQSQG